MCMCVSATSDDLRDDSTKLSFQVLHSDRRFFIGRIFNHIVKDGCDRYVLQLIR